jgi:hypothetical protein
MCIASSEKNAQADGNAAGLCFGFARVQKSGLLYEDRTRPKVRMVERIG